MLLIHHSRWPRERLGGAWTQLIAWLHSGFIRISWHFLPAVSQNCNWTKIHYAEKIWMILSRYGCYAWCVCTFLQLVNVGFSCYCVLSKYWASLLRTFLSFIFLFSDSKQQKYKLRTKDRVKETCHWQKCFSWIEKDQGETRREIVETKRTNNEHNF